MKRIEDLFNPVAAQSLVAGVFAAMIAFASGSGVAAQRAVDAQTTGADRVEARIHDMHGKLNITAAQEDQWQQVAEVMRDNEAAIEPLVKDRKTNANTMTAIDDLKSYAAITDAHSEGIKKFTAAFATLYDGMSDAQKKDADALFRKGDQKRLKAK